MGGRTCLKRGSSHLELWSSASASSGIKGSEAAALWLIHSSSCQLRVCVRHTVRHCHRRSVAVAVTATVAEWPALVVLGLPGSLIVDCRRLGQHE